ncbi:MAG: phosphate/phosphite/phosphonate ABC transporter substrate-binding protein [Gammaproteobacteria bacterium]|nr:phosphate/phosphite/phosphonate ABC transporter substrate-binding protein [Gammaproteobacteria bacterium]
MWSQGIVAGPRAQEGTQGKTSDPVYQFGMLPYLSPEALARTWGPLVTHLEKSLNAKIIMRSAPDYKTYIQRTQNLEYDFLLTAPHFAVLAKKESGYHIIARYSKALSGDIVVRKDAPYKDITSLKGAVFATPDRLAVITLLGELALKEQGLVASKNITIKYTPSHNNALISVVEGKADAAVAIGGLYLRMSPKVRNSLRLLARTQQVPHAMLIASPKVSDKTLNALIEGTLSPKHRSGLLEFEAKLNWGNLQAVSKNDIQQLTPLLSLLKSRLAQ